MWDKWIMKNFDRRFLATILGMALLFVLGISKGVPVADGIVYLAIGLAGANAAQASAKYFAARGNPHIIGAHNADERNGHKADSKV